jgi:hypothetical protein
MDLELIRYNKNKEYTEGKLYINGVYFCDTLENPDRGLHQNMRCDAISKLKVNGETCIPYGEYKIFLTMSPKFKKPMPLIYPVKFFEGIRIHPGITVRDTEGCILVGEKESEGTLMCSQEVFEKLMKLLEITNYKCKIIIK